MVHLTSSVKEKAIALPINKSVPNLIRAALLFSMTLFWVFASAQTAVFINEIHYDNTGSDADEGVEIAGPAGTDLTGWVIWKYNGSNNDTYGSVNLSGVIPDEGGSGFGTLNFLFGSNGLQNGAPDGMALVDDLANVIQFLTYEGQITATGGVAIGMTSEDIGVSETSSTPIGESLQLTGTGACYEDFTWTGPVAHSRGTLNSGQTMTGTCAPPACGISIGAESAVCNSTTTGPGNDTYDLSIPYTGMDAGATVVNNSGSGSIGGDDPTLTNGGTILISGISEDDAYSVTFGSPCNGTTVSGAAPDCEPVVTSDVFITEIADPDNLTSARFVEIHNAGPTTIDFSTGWALRRWTNGNAAPQADVPLDGCIPPGGFYLVANNGGVFSSTYGFDADQDIGTGGPADSNGDDNIALVDNTNTIVDIYGVPGEDGSGTCHNFEDGRAERAASVTGGVPTYDEAEWNNWSDSPILGCTSYVQDPQDAPADFDPGSWIGAVPTGCGISVKDCEASASCNTVTSGPGDTYDLSIPYSGVDGLVTVINNSGSGSVGGDNPAVVPDGTIIISGIDEADAYNVTFSGACGLFTVAGAAPLCEPPPILINEVDYDNAGPDEAEFIELVNVGAVPFDLTGCTIDLVNQSSTVYNTIVLDPVILAAGDYFVICGNGGNVANCDQVIPVLNDIIQNGHFSNGVSADGIQLKDASANVLDQMSYEGDNPVTVETAGVIPYDTIPGASLQRLPDGTDTDDNSADFGLACITPGTANVATAPSILSVGSASATCDAVNPGPGDTYTLTIPYFNMDAGAVVTNNSGSGTPNIGDDPAFIPDGIMLFLGIAETDNYDISIDVDCVPIVVSGAAPFCDPPVPPALLVINEVDYAQAGTDDSEFIEIYNADAVPVDMTNYTLELINGSNDSQYGGSPYLLDPVVLAPGDYWVLCGDASNVANCDQVIAPATNLIQNGAPDAIGLRNAAGDLLDALSYEGDVAAPYVETAGSIGDTDDDQVGISRVPNGVDTDDNSADWALACITPGAENVCDALFCTGVGPCEDVTLEILTDNSGSETTWEIIPDGGCEPLCTGGPYSDGSPILLSELCCLPDGCYSLSVFDSFGDGISAGSYTLRDNNGERIIDADGQFVSTSSVGSPFCIPLSTTKVIDFHCDRLDFLNTDYVIAAEDAAVSAEFGVNDGNSGYQFWFFDPHGTYNRRVFYSHAYPTVGAPPGVLAAAHLRFSNLNTNPVPNDLLLNVRVRGRVNGSNNAFGPACTMMVLSAPVACPTTQLIDNLAHPLYSCGVNREFGGSDKVTAWPVAGANRYKFRFVNAGEGYTRNIAGPSASRVLSWITNPLQDGVTYEVSVAVSFDNGANYCPFGSVCEVSIGPIPPGCGNGVLQSGEECDDGNNLNGDGCAFNCTLEGPAASDRYGRTSDVEFNLFPNPNSGDNLQLRVNGLDNGEHNVALEIHDVYGKMVYSSNEPISGDSYNSMIQLGGTFSSGMYLVSLQIDGTRYNDRLIIE